MTTPKSNNGGSSRQTTRTIKQTVTTTAPGTTPGQRQTIIDPRENFSQLAPGETANQQTGSARQTVAPARQTISPNSKSTVQANQKQLSTPIPTPINRSATKLNSSTKLASNTMLAGSSKFETGELHDVIIIGAGLSGLSAAAKLINNGVKDLVVLEAQGYVGGRIKNVFFENDPTNVIDLGAQFVHGNSHTLYQIVKKLNKIVPGSEGPTDNAQSENDFSSRTFHLPDGSMIPMTKFSKLLIHLEEEIGPSFSDNESDSDDQYVFDENVTLGDFCDKVFKDFIKGCKRITPDQRMMYEAVYNWYITEELMDSGARHLKDVMCWASDEYELKGDKFLCLEGGMGSIISSLLSLIPHSAIRLHTPVENINWSNPSDLVRLTLANGQLMSANHVITTCSLGYIQAHHSSLFTPQLPLKTQTALNHVGFGAIGKIFLRWEKAWWGSVNVEDPSELKSFDFLWPRDYCQLMVKSDVSQRKTASGAPWWYGIMSMETFMFHKTAVEIWLSKDQAEIVEKLGDEEVIAVLCEILRSFLKKNVPPPQEMIRTKWITNPYVLGCYSYPSSTFKKADLEFLGKPLPSHEEPKLLFAGEAYILKYMSAAHGALASGEQQADTILRKKDVDEPISLLNLFEPVI